MAKNFIILILIVILASTYKIEDEQVFLGTKSSTSLKTSTEASAVLTCYYTFIDSRWITISDNDLYLSSCKGNKNKLTIIY